MYDFYGNPPETKSQLREWLLSWLQKPATEDIFELHDDHFVQELGFVRAGYAHCIFRNIKTGNYVWWVYRNDTERTVDSFPDKRYSTVDELIGSVVDQYYVDWKLTK